MAGKKNIYIEAEIEFAEMQLASWRAYVEDNPFESLKDRVEMKQTRTGGVIPMVVSTIEQQGKFLQDTMKNYLALLDVVNKLREGEEAKKTEARGRQEVTLFEGGKI